MKRSAFCSWIVAVLATATGARGALQEAGGSEGDACAAQDGRSGVCRPVDDCPDARRRLQQGEKPLVCSFHGLAPVVCCFSVAERMCQKYGEAVYREECTFQWPPQRVKVNQCATNGIPFVTGGVKAVPNEFPHMALLGYGATPQEPEPWDCGGSLVSNRYVLTAAHCVFTSSGAPKWVRLGELHVMKQNETNKHKDFAVAKVIVHPKHEDGIFDNDIALLKLDRTVNFTASIRPVCLHAQKAIQSDKAIATGWGIIDWTQPDVKSDHLMKVQLPIHDSEICQSVFQSKKGNLPNGIVDQSMVCAGSLTNGKDTCKGDSGGPLQLKLTKPYCMHSVVGVTSFGKGQCGQNFPAVYTRVSHFLPWIESVVWPQGQDESDAAPQTQCARRDRR